MSNKFEWVTVFQSKHLSSSLGMKMLLKMSGIRVRLKKENVRPPWPVSIWHVQVANSRVNHAKVIIELIREIKSLGIYDDEIGDRVHRWLNNISSKESPKC